jgi:hypothetical protein
MFAMMPVCRMQWQYWSGLVQFTEAIAAGSQAFYSFHHASQVSHRPDVAFSQSCERVTVHLEGQGRDAMGVENASRTMQAGRSSAWGPTWARATEASRRRRSVDNGEIMLLALESIIVSLFPQDEQKLPDLASVCDVRYMCNCKGHLVRPLHRMKLGKPEKEIRNAPAPEWQAWSRSF